MTTMKGRAIWVRTQAVAVVENGKTTRLEGTFQDITERKRAEAVLLDSEAKYRALLENVPTAVVVHGPDTVVAYSNPTPSSPTAIRHRRRLQQSDSVGRARPDSGSGTGEVRRGSVLAISAAGWHAAPP
jgi:PAS domain-containing protein